MKFIPSLVLTISMLLFFTSCAPRQSNNDSSEKSSAIPETDPSSAQETLSIYSPAESSDSSPSVSDVLPQQSSETAVFSLASSGVEGKLMKVGDTIGDWTLTDLKITYFKDTDNIRMVESVFSGEVILKGTISRSNLLEDGYDFLIAEEDQGSIPKYISPEATKDVDMFMLDIPENFGNKPRLEHGEQMKCNITINRYKFTFAYTMAPNSATLVRIEELPDTDIVTSGFTIVGYDDQPGDFKYKIDLTEEQQEEFQEFLEVGKWLPLAPENRPEHGLNCVLQALHNDRILFIFEFDSQNSIIKIDIDGSARTYWAPSQVAAESKSFMERLRGQLVRE